jgi:hypothetical protein
VAKVYAAFVDAGFVVRQKHSIHDSESIRFVTDVLKAGNWHANLLYEGLHFEWISQPSMKYSERNNKSALDNISKLRETVESWHEAGFIELCDTAPLCVNPMTVAVQYNAVTDTTKYRLCIDLSCHVNNFIGKMPAKLDEFTLAQELISPGDYMVALDLENQFCQVRLHPEMKQYLGLQYRIPTALENFTNSVMPYGCKPAVAVATRLLKPVKAFVHRYDVKFSFYVDGGCISCASKVTCHAQLCFVIHVLHLCGWRIQWKKTIFSPSTSLSHQGFITDSVAMRYFITPDKWQKIHQHITAVHAAALANNSVSVTDVASLLGHITALRRSHGLVTVVMTRSLQHHLGLHTSVRFPHPLRSQHRRTNVHQRQPPRVSRPANSDGDGGGTHL